MSAPENGAVTPEMMKKLDTTSGPANVAPIEVIEYDDAE